MLDFFLPGNTHDNCHNNGDLHGSNDSSYEHIMKFLTTGYHIQDVKVSDLITLCSCVTWVTPVEKQETIWNSFSNKCHFLMKTWKDAHRSMQPNTRRSPAGGDAKIKFTLAMSTEVGVVLRAGNGHPAVSFSFTSFCWVWKNNNRF